MTTQSLHIELNNKKNYFCSSYDRRLVQIENKLEKLRQEIDDRIGCLTDLRVKLEDEEALLWQQFEEEKKLVGIINHNR